MMTLFALPQPGPPADSRILGTARSCSRLAEGHAEHAGTSDPQHIAPRHADLLVTNVLARSSEQSPHGLVIPCCVHTVWSVYS